MCSVLGAAEPERVEEPGGEIGLSYFREGQENMDSDSWGGGGLAPLASAIFLAKTPDGRFEPGGGGSGFAFGESFASGIFRSSRDEEMAVRFCCVSRIKRPNSAELIWLLASASRATHSAMIWMSGRSGLVNFSF